MLVPGLGTAAGLLLGGYGGRKYSGRSKSEDGGGSGGGSSSGRHRHRDAFYEGKDLARRDREAQHGYSGESSDDLDSGYRRSGHRDRGKSGRRRGESGWDDGSATFKSGTAVR